MVIAASRLVTALLFASACLLGNLSSRKYYVIVVYTLGSVISEYTKW